MLLNLLFKIIVNCFGDKNDVDMYINFINGMLVYEFLSIVKKKEVDFVFFFILVLIYCGNKIGFFSYLIC